MLAAAIDRLANEGIALEPLLGDREVQRAVLALLDDRLSIAQFVQVIKQAQKRVDRSA